jgi:hypothetical protein
LAGRKTRLTQYLDDPLGKKALFRWNRGRVSFPTKLRANVLVQASLRASDLVCSAMQVAYLIERDSNSASSSGLTPSSMEGHPVHPLGPATNVRRPVPVNQSSPGEEGKRERQDRLGT